MMNKDAETTYLENIEECIFDENKIVTYKWLSRYLGLHVNISKQLLYTYAKRCSKRNEISLTYLVAGIPKHGEGIEMCVIRESDLERAKEGLQRITSEHVYSIQKVVLKDLNELYTADKDESFESEDNTQFSAIEFDCVRRDDSFFEKLKTKIAAAIKTETQATSSVKQKASQPEDRKNAASGAVVVNGTKVSDENTTDKDGSKKTVVPSMFAKAAAASKKVPPAKVNSAQSKTSKQTGMTAFLSKALPAKPKEDNTTHANNKPENLKRDGKNDTKEHQSDKNKGHGSEMEVELVENEKENSVKNVNSKTNTAAIKGKKKETKKANRRHKEGNNKETQPKKRRRIMFIDSDSDSSEESAHSEREPTPPPRVSSPPVDNADVITATPEPKARHQRRRFVNKSYVDDDGYIVTKKEYIFEDCSDSGSEKQTETKNDELKGTKSESQSQGVLSKEKDTESQKEVSYSPTKNKNSIESKKKPVKAKNVKNSKKNSSPHKAASPKKNKQQSITNFFTKKT